MHTTMTSQVDPRKIKALLKDSQTSLEQGDDEEEEGAAGGDEGDEEEEGADEGGEGEEVTVESLTEDLKPAVESINEIIDEFRTGSDAQPKAGIEQLEEELDAEAAHAFCEWTVEAGKKDFRKLGEALDLEDVDGFVGWCRAVRRAEEDGEGEGAGDEAEDEGAAEGGDDGSGDAGGGEEEDEGGEELA
jgi:hypothetical protein